MLSLGLSEAFRYHRPPNVHRARELVNDESGKYRLHRSDLTFTVFTHNMGLLPLFLLLKIIWELIEMEQ